MYPPRVTTHMKGHSDHDVPESAKPDQARRTSSSQHRQGNRSCRIC